MPNSIIVQLMSGALTSMKLPSWYSPCVLDSKAFTYCLKLVINRKSQNCPSGQSVYLSRVWRIYSCSLSPIKTNRPPCPCWDYEQAQSMPIPNFYSARSGSNNQQMKTVNSCHPGVKNFPGDQKIAERRLPHGHPLPEKHGFKNFL